MCPEDESLLPPQIVLSALSQSQDTPSSSADLMPDISEVQAPGEMKKRRQVEIGEKGTLKKRKTVRA